MKHRYIHRLSTPDHTVYFEGWDGGRPEKILIRECVRGRETSYIVPEPLARDVWRRLHSAGYTSSLQRTANIEAVSVQGSFPL